MTKRERTAVVAYVLMAVATFSWSASDPRHTCVYPPDRCIETGDRFFSGLAAGLAWPLYWSWTAADYVRAALGDNHEDA